MARGGALGSGGGGGGVRRGCGDQELLDRERKEELILAKQVRQGTTVILGGNFTRVSSKG